MSWWIPECTALLIARIHQLPGAVRQLDCQWRWVAAVAHILQARGLRPWRTNQPGRSSSVVCMYATAVLKWPSPMNLGSQLVQEQDGASSHAANDKSAARRLHIRMYVASMLQRGHGHAVARQIANDNSQQPRCHGHLLHWRGDLRSTHLPGLCFHAGCYVGQSLRLTPYAVDCRWECGVAAHTLCNPVATMQPGSSTDRTNT